MRDIQFRGKTKSGEWKFGYLFAKIVLNLYFILEWENQWMVDPETVGQYTGLHDKNGQKIYEGDIVFIPRMGRSYEVKFMFGQFCVGINCPVSYERHSCEVIGNIHDNPELLKEDE